MDATPVEVDEPFVRTIWRYPIKSMMGEEVPSTEVTARGVRGDRAYALVETATNRAAVVRTWAADLMRYRAQFVEEPRAERSAPPVRITCPDGATLITTQADLDEQLSAGFGRGLSLLSQAPDGLLIEFPAGTLAGKAAQVTEAPLGGRSPTGTFFDLACVHLIATSTLEHLQEGYPAGQVDVRRFRPNILVQTSGEPFVENTWVGRTMAVGDEALLRVSMPCPRCVTITLPQDGLTREGGLLRHVARNNMVDLGDFGRLPCVGVYADVIKPGRIRREDRVRWLD